MFNSRFRRHGYIGVAVIGVLPLLLSMILFLTSKPYLSLLFVSRQGQRLLLLSGGLTLLAVTFLAVNIHLQTATYPRPSQKILSNFAAGILTVAGMLCGFTANLLILLGPILISISSN